MVVVEDQNEIRSDGRDFVKQACQKRFVWRWLRGLKHTQQACSNIWSNRLQSKDEIRQKARGIVVTLIE